MVKFVLNLNNDIEIVKRISIFRFLFKIWKKTDKARCKYNRKRCDVSINQI